MSSSDQNPPSALTPQSQVSKRLQGLFAGACAGGFAKTATAPFDRVKILCQTGNSSTPIAAVKDVFKQEGTIGFWKGNAASVLRIIPNRGILFMCSDFIKDMMRGFKTYPVNVKPPSLNAAQYIGAGAISGVVTVIATYPLDLIRGRLTGSVGSNSPYKGIVQTCMLTVREEGFRALYRGMSVSLVGAFPYEGIRFGVYDILKSRYIASDSPIYCNVAVGAVSGLTAATLMYPNDTVRRRLQLQRKGRLPGVEHYSSGWDCYRQLYRQAGLRLFYRGLSANLLRAAPSAALQFGSFEFIKKQFALHELQKRSL